MQINHFNSYAVKDKITQEKSQIQKRQSKSEESFSGSFLENMGQEAKPDIEKADRLIGRNTEEKDVLRMGNKRHINILTAETDKMQFMKEVPVRGIGYGQSDKVTVNVLEGYILKAKIEKNEPDGALSIYVEAKYDDGRTKAYRMEENNIEEASNNPIKQIAYEALTAEKNG